MIILTIYKRPALHLAYSEKNIQGMPLEKGGRKYMNDIRSGAELLSLLLIFGDGTVQMDD